MEYVSTRGSASALEFREVTLAGLASDGGLYVPRHWPQFTAEQIAAMAGKPYCQLAAEVMAPFVAGSLDFACLLQLCEQAYGRFAHGAVTPLRQLDAQHWLLELFHGPTLAFKDVALQLLGLLFEEFLKDGDRHLTVVGATSGDTGSAAIDALAGRPHVDVFMLHPKGRVSEVQRRQMTTVLAGNIHNIAIDGSFDDAQAMVKRMFQDRAMTDRFRISAVNSINWARLMAQVVYYFAAGVALGAPYRKIAFSVPTGNFGDVFAGYVAARMGLPVERLIVATNVNDILHRAITTADYSAQGVTPTAAPSMDIQVSSNFERLLFDLGDRDGAAMAGQMREFDQAKAMRLTPAQHQRAGALFTSARATGDEMDAAMRWAVETTGELVDPHTAIGLHAARSVALPPHVPVVTLATAHPAKFAPAVKAATGIHPPLPDRLADLLEREERFDELPGDYDTVSRYIAARAKVCADPIH
ncbi:threonine synthase [Croceicoccus sp. F390]|uniref:Threonine synthase n=1 Tax=Croceicoccus esteveae TaxID=3075597 RepID=A0ABU2ZF81_9SPHN|nr:threonine synthase [Croceicoccus sp. F390]MDT0575248.1 threonine synthase [Croceicoccus sp. F390]